MTDTTTTAPANEPGHRKAARTSAPKLRDGVMKRGRTWSYVIRVPDSATGVSKPRWVGGFETEEAAKAAILGLNGKDWKGRALTVNEARPREERPARGGGGGGYRGGQRSRY